MLQKISVQNFALINQLEVSFVPGFTTITGESGSGKSVLLKALSLALGERADRKSLKNPDLKCQVEVHFVFSPNQSIPGSIQPWLENNQLTLQRTINPKGQSKAAINGTPVTVEDLRQVGEQLVDIHSQHETLQLRDEDFTLDFIDLYGRLSDPKNQYATDYKNYEQALREHQSLKQKIAQAQKDEDYLRYQLGLFEGFQAVDLTEIEAEYETLSHADELTEQIQKIDQWLGQMHENAQLIQAQAEPAAAKFAPLANHLPRYKALNIELEDLCEEMRDLQRRLVSNPVRQQELQQTIGQVYRLQKKFGLETVTDLVAYQQDLQTQLDRLDSSDWELEQAAKKVQTALEQVQISGEKLSHARFQVVTQLEPQIIAQLDQVKMSDSVLQLQRIEKPVLDHQGLETYQFVYAAHQNLQLQPLGHVASGGEMGRIMLILKSLISSQLSVTTLILDEIDTGVSGEVAERMAELMQQMAQNLQIWSITHLPQVAAAGAQQYSVQKSSDDEQIWTGIKRLDSTQRVEQIAQMLSGSQVTASAREQAKSLLT